MFCWNHFSFFLIVCFRWGQMAPAEWDSNSSSPRLRWCRPRALILSDGTFPAGTPPHLPSHTRVFPITALVNSALGVLPQNATFLMYLTSEAGDLLGSHHTNGLGWNWREKGDLKRRCRSGSAEEAALVLLCCKIPVKLCNNRCLLFLLDLCHLPNCVCGNMKFCNEICTVFAKALCPLQTSLVGCASVLPPVTFLIAALQQCPVPQNESSSKTELLYCK